jgi:hypothetical protein
MQSDSGELRECEFRSKEPKSKQTLATAAEKLKHLPEKVACRL